MCKKWCCVYVISATCFSVAYSISSLLKCFDLTFLISFFSVPPAFRVISCEASVVCLTALPSRLWIQTPVAFGNAPSVITSCGAQPVPLQKDGKRPKWRCQSQWLRYQTKRMAQVQQQEERACPQRKEGWRSVSSPEGPLFTGPSPCP